MLEKTTARKCQNGSWESFIDSRQREIFKQIK